MSHCFDCHSKNLLCFDDLDRIFKVRSQHTNVKFSLKMRYFFNQLIDIPQTCIDTRGYQKVLSLRHFPHSDSTMLHT